LAKTLTLSQPTKELLMSAKIDHQLTKNNQLTARITCSATCRTILLVQIAPIATLDSFGVIVVHDTGLNVSDTWSVTPTTVNEFRFYFSPEPKSNASEE